MIRLMLAASLAAAGLFYWNQSHGPMDGAVFDVRVKQASLFSFSRGDTLQFDSGKLTVAGGLSDGFSASRYTATPAGEATHWQAVMQAADGQQMSWQGVALGDRVEGTVLWSDPSGRTRRLNFRGNRRS